MDKKNKLVAGTKEILVLFEEANGLWINLQGKDRKEQIEKYKSICENEGKEYKEPTSVKSELKLHVSYEGWKKDDKRHSLVNKMYIAGFMTSSELKKIRDAQIYQKYDVSKIQFRILNGDGASWISRLATKEIEYRSPGIMERQIFTVLSKKFKSRKIKFFKIWCNMFSKDLCNKGTRRCCRNTTNKRRGIKGNSIEEYMKEVKKVVKNTKKALIKLNNEENIKEYNNVYLEPQNPIYQVLKQTPISELEYII